MKVCPEDYRLFRENDASYCVSEDEFYALLNRSNTTYTTEINPVSLIGKSLIQASIIIFLIVLGIVMKFL